MLDCCKYVAMIVWMIIDGPSSLPVLKPAVCHIVDTELHPQMVQGVVPSAVYLWQVVGSRYL